MKNVDYQTIVKKPYAAGALIRNDFPGFKEDYLVIHCLIRCYSPTRFMEIGTSTGRGTNVICRAMGVYRLLNKSINVYSIDVPPGTNPDIIYPDHEDGHPLKAGVNCKFPYHQIFGDSHLFDFTPFYPLDGWFIDGKHDYDYCLADSKNAFLSQPRIVIWHDCQIEGVMLAVNEAVAMNDNYDAFSVSGTRIAYAVLRSEKQHP